jgi:hypothetical protein
MDWVEAGHHSLPTISSSAECTDGSGQPSGRLLVWVSWHSAGSLLRALARLVVALPHLMGARAGTLDASFATTGLSLAV